jgi:hypothetical protein
MGDAADIPAATHFGRDNLNASGPVIDLVAEDDLPRTDSLKSDDDWVYPFPTDFKIQEHPIDEIRPLKVGIIELFSRWTLLMAAGGGNWSRHRWDHCWSALADQGPRHTVDYFRQEQRRCA